jgi:hypothetical protein
MGAIAVVLLAGAATTAGGAEHENCPMAKASAHRMDVDHRHQDTTGVPTDGSEHHFVLAGRGGSIRLEARTGSPETTVVGIREHLQAITRAFAAGDFSMPRRIHDRVPPGVEVMIARKDAIDYAYSDTPAGGVVTLTTDDAQALAAIHEFLRFQIRDHGTSNPIE